MDLNIEIKAADRDPAATRERCARLGATDEGLLHQRDTYFDVPAGRLKLREEPGTAELIYYERPSDEGVRPSRYVRAQVAGEQTRQLLTACLGVAGTVTKKRRLFLCNEVRIHLDEVEGLGAFIELEAVVSERMDAEQAHAGIELLLEALGIESAGLEPRGYLDLLAASRT